MTDVLTRKEQHTMPENLFWNNKRVVVTGGAGFLGSFVIEKLVTHGAKEILIPQIEDYNLIDRDSINQLFGDALQPIDKIPPHLKSATFQPSNHPTIEPENLVI